MADDLITEEEINVYLSTQLPLLIQARSPQVLHDLARHNGNKTLQCLMLGIIWRTAFKLTSPLEQYRLGKTWLSVVPQTEESGTKVDLVQIARRVLQ